MPLSTELLSTLDAMPQQLDTLLQQIPTDRLRWEPASWDGIPGERFSAVGHLCHLRDIEVDGYHLRIKRMLDETDPTLESVDGYRLATERQYTSTVPEEALAAFRDARAQTIALLATLDDAQLARPGSFRGFGDTTLRGLVHYLCSHDQQHLACLHWLMGKMQA